MNIVSDEVWQENKSGLVSTTINDRFQLRADGNNNRFMIDPLPTSAENLSFFYVTDTWCRSNGGTRQNEWAADNDVLLLDEMVYEMGLKWRFLRVQGRDYQTEYMEYKIELDKAFAQDGGMETLYVEAAGTEQDRFVANLPDTGLG